MQDIPHEILEHQTASLTSYTAFSSNSIYSTTYASHSRKLIILNKTMQECSTLLSTSVLHLQFLPSSSFNYIRMSKVYMNS